MSIDRDKHPSLFIDEKDKTPALKELTAALNAKLEKEIASGGLLTGKRALCNIVNKALTPGQEKAMNALPETIEIPMDKYGKDHTFMESLTLIAANSSVVVEHTVNATALILQYCFFHGLGKKETARLALSALLHDVGSSQLDKTLMETDQYLTDEAFEDKFPRDIFKKFTSCLTG